MPERTTRIEAWSFADLVVTDTVVFSKGEMACWDTSTGLIVKGQASTTLRPIGHFFENGTGDGVVVYSIRLFKELRLHWWDNDAGPNDVEAADIGSDVYIVDEKTVGTLATGRSVAGVAWAINSRYGVLVSMAIDDSGPTSSFASGEYAPTLTDETNIAASVLVAARFMRINNTVTVFFGVTLDITGAGAAELGISLPVASDLAAAGDLTGHANSEVVGEDQAVIAGDATNDRAAMTYTGIATGVIAWAGSFSYQVL